MTRKVNSFVVSSLGLILRLPRKNISYADITDRSKTYNMVASGVQIVCFDLALFVCFELSSKFKAFTEVLCYSTKSEPSRKLLLFGFRNCIFFNPDRDR